MPDLNLSFIGAGNVAHHLIYRCLQSGHNIKSVACMSERSAELIGKKFGIDDLFVGEKSHVYSKSTDILIVAVNDDAVRQLDIIAEEVLIVHTSGSVSKDIFSAISSRYGVFYPLQSLRVENYMDTSIQMPVLIESSRKEDEELLQKFAKSIGSPSSIVDEYSRNIMHLSAVFANNFTNHMWHLAENQLTANSMDFELLLPLIENSVMNFRKYKPSECQTGPALRKDGTTMSKHLELLSNDKNAQELYKMISESIIRSAARAKDIE